MGECRGVDGIRKNIYLRRGLADRAARRAERKHGWRMRVYECTTCGYFHLARQRHEGLPVLLLDYIQGDGQ